MRLREHALRVAVLAALTDEVKRAYSAARKDAEKAFAIARADGTKQQAVMLPDGTEIGLISIKAPSPSVKVDEAALLAWADEHVPSAVEETVEPGAWSDLDVIALVKERFPDLVQRRIRPSAREAMVKEMASSGGAVADKQTGEAAVLATVDPQPPTGAFTYRAAPDAAARIVAEWHAGRLGQIGLGQLALPGADEDAA